MTFLLLVLGTATLIRLLYKGIARPLVYPVLRKLALLILRRRSKLLVATEKGVQKAGEEKRWVLVYGACSTLGKTVAKVFAMYNYGLLLVDSNLSKL